MKVASESIDLQKDDDTLVVDLPVQNMQPSFINTRGAALNYVSPYVSNGESAHCSERDN